MSQEQQSQTIYHGNWAFKRQPNGWRVYHAPWTNGDPISIIGENMKESELSHFAFFLDKIVRDAKDDVRRDLFNRLAVLMGVQNHG